MNDFIMAIHEDLPGVGIGKLIGEVALLGLACLGIYAAKSYYDNKREIQH